MFDIKKSGNPKIYIEILLLNFMSSINGDFVGKSSDIKVSQEKIMLFLMIKRMNLFLKNY